ncbi:succinate dehydrogenase membrane anchor subunit [Starmerella bacillaris]|uniref:Succinate dehydrogenase [ubiquinone] cytochrome b small subunit n=1 Tax=Starmerella bacillaris TaxID=1247836 RepID=A0AAV5RET0_STABA|nr:succinate dehydrogenase membrane anchor subunit [Starmerella bacillaris]
MLRLLSRPSLKASLAISAPRSVNLLNAGLSSRLSKSILSQSALPSIGIRSLSATPKRLVFEQFGVKQPPGYIVGTVNDAVKLGKPDKVHGPYHWLFERIDILVFAPLIGYAISAGSLPPILDATMGLFLLAHMHMGFGSCITDYVPKRLFPKLGPLCFFLLGCGTAVSAYGLYKLETEEEGLVGAAKTLWRA